MKFSQTHSVALNTSQATFRWVPGKERDELYDYRQISTVHLELSSHCNAACPMCPRNEGGGAVVENLPLKSLSLSEIRQFFEMDFVRQLRSIYICGTYGEPIMAKECLEVIKYFKETSPNTYLILVTNGGSRSSDWWHEMASVVNEVQFSIDGLQDTNHIYRRKIQFEKVMENARAFISGGGRARWEYLIFRHNEHQVDEARELAMNMGFSEFRVRRSERFSWDSHARVHRPVPVYDKNRNFEYFIEPASNPDFLNPAIEKKARPPSSQSQGVPPVNCRAINEKSVYIDANGFLIPCCWLGAYIDRSYAPWSESQVDEFFDRAPSRKEHLNLRNRSLREIFEDDLFQKTLPQTWGTTGQLDCCSNNCRADADILKGQYQ